MTDVTISQSAPLQISYPRWLLWMVLGAWLFTVVMLVVGLLAWLIEEDVNAPYLLVVWVGFVLVLSYLLATLPRQIRIENETLCLQWWWRSLQLPVNAVTAVTSNQSLVTVCTADRQARFTFLFPNHATALVTLLEVHVPAVAAARVHRLARELPITLRPRLIAPLIMGGMGAAMVALGVLLLWTVYQNRFDMSLADRIGLGLLSVGIDGVGGMLVLIVLTHYTWRFTFGHDTIRLRKTFRTETYDPQYITKLELVTEERTVKGFVHQIYQLRLYFMDGTQVDIAPNLPSFPTDYAGAEEARQLGELKLILEQHYVPLLTCEVDPGTVDDARWGKPLMAHQWQIRPYDLSIYRLDYGEHHAAASTIHFLVGHVAAGAMRFRTTNGELCISPDGRYIVLYDNMLLIAFNLDNGRTYHRASRRSWLYHRVWIEGELLMIEEMQRTDVQARELRKPISLEQPTSALRRGFGSAVNGAFPSAYDGGVVSGG